MEAIIWYNCSLHSKQKELYFTFNDYKSKVRKERRKNTTMKFQRNNQTLLEISEQL